MHDSWLIRGSMTDAQAKNHFGFGHSESNGSSTSRDGNGRGADYAGLDDGAGFGARIVHNPAGGGRSRRNAQS